MGGEAHVMAGFANFKKEGKRGEGKKLLLAEVSVLENKTSIFGTQDPQLCRYSENRAWSNKGMSHGHAVIFKCLQKKCFYRHSRLRACACLPDRSAQNEAASGQDARDVCR
jgi:hypothetical protein